MQHRARQRDRYLDPQNVFLVKTSDERRDGEARTTTDLTTD